MRTVSTRPAGCPDWCTLVHGQYAGEEDLVHMSDLLVLRNTTIQLCATIDPDTGVQDGPYVLVDQHEYSLDEAAALVGVLTDLLNAGRDLTPRAGGGTRSPGP